VSTPIAFSEEERRLRAELAAELGWYPADLDDGPSSGTAPTPPARRPIATPQRSGHT